MGRGGWGLRVGILMAGAALCSAGCGWPEEDTATPAVAATSGSTDSEQVLAGSAERPPAADPFAELEPNDDFDHAQPISFNETVKLNGSIEGRQTPFDRDVYDLGPVGPGDRVLADLTADDGSDVLLGLYDGRQRLIGHIDPSSAASGPRQADLVIREASDHLYVVAATRSQWNQGRAYTASLSVQRGGDNPPVRGQIVILNFSGVAGVRVGSRAPVDIPPFDAAAINTAYAGRTEEMINAILARVREDFNGLGVSIYRDGDPAAPAGGYSTIYYGSYDSRLLGLADNVDPYNARPEQSAILYTDTFAIFNPLAPTVGQMAQVLANTTSHEAGHLLGLRHTSDPTDLMDTTATARQMLVDQDFSFAALNASVMPMGFQDAPALLAWTVGGGLAPAPAGKIAARRKALQMTGGPDDFYIPRDWLMSCSGADDGGK